MAAPRICLCHLLKEENKSKIHVFSAKTWHKFVGCANEWVSLDGYEQHCAEVFVNKGIKEHGDQDGFHLKCYQHIYSSKHCRCMMYWVYGCIHTC